MNVLLVDDHVLSRKEMNLLLSGERDLIVVGEAATGEQAVEEAERLTPDVIVMDILLPGMTGIEATQIIKRNCPTVRIVALTNHSGRNLVKAFLNAGGHGYVRKDRAFEELISAVRSVAAGKAFLGDHVKD